MSIATYSRPAGAAVTKDGHRTWCMNCGKNVRGLGKSCICSYHISTDGTLFTLLMYSGWAPQVVSTCTQCGPNVLGLIFFNRRRASKAHTARHIQQDIQLDTYSKTHTARHTARHIQQDTYSKTHTARHTARHIQQDTYNKTHTVLQFKISSIGVYTYTGFCAAVQFLKSCRKFLFLDLL